MRSCAMCRRLCCINCTVFLGLHRGPYCFQCCDRVREEILPRGPGPRLCLVMTVSSRVIHRSGDNMQYTFHRCLYQIHFSSNPVLLCAIRTVASLQLNMAPKAVGDQTPAERRTEDDVALDLAIDESMQDENEVEAPAVVDDAPQAKPNWMDRFAQDIDAESDDTMEEHDPWGYPGRSK